MRIFLFSGSGEGAGKSSTSSRLCQETWSLAAALRRELQDLYPGYDWFNKSQAYKDGTFVAEYPTRATVRDVMIAHGQTRCQGNPGYWAERLVDRLNNQKYVFNGVTCVGVDDVRKVIEKEVIVKAFPGQVTHFHIETPHAKREPIFENEELRDVADYILQWSR